MMVVLDRHRKYVPQSQRYYEKKRSEGKKHNQAIRALGRDLSRIIYKMLTEERQYQMRPEKKSAAEGQILTLLLKANEEP